MTEVRMKQSLAGGNSLVRAKHHHFLKGRDSSVTSQKIFVQIIKINVSVDC